MEQSSSQLVDAVSLTKQGHGTGGNKRRCTDESTNQADQVRGASRPSQRTRGERGEAHVHDLAHRVTAAPEGSNKPVDASAGSDDGHSDAGRSQTDSASAAAATRQGNSSSGTQPQPADLSDKKRRKAKRGKKVHGRGAGAGRDLAWNGEPRFDEMHGSWQAARRRHGREAKAMTKALRSGPAEAVEVKLQGSGTE